MRFSDSLGGFTVKPVDDKSGYLGKYMPAVAEIARVTGVPASRWEAYEDYQQRSTREGGCSSCAFLTTRFASLQDAFAAATALNRELPSVNLELYVAPGGRQDQGDGVGRYDASSRLNQQSSTYIQNEGFGVALLVDAQNVDRHLRNKPASGAAETVAQPWYKKLKPW